MKTDLTLTAPFCPDSDRPVRQAEGGGGWLPRRRSYCPSPFAGDCPPRGHPQECPTQDTWKFLDWLAETLRGLGPPARLPAGLLWL